MAPRGVITVDLNVEDMMPGKYSSARVRYSSGKGECTVLKNELLDDSVFYVAVHSAVAADDRCAVRCVVWSLCQTGNACAGCQSRAGRAGDRIGVDRQRRGRGGGGGGGDMRSELRWAEERPTSSDT